MKKVILIFLIIIVNTFNAQISISVKNYNESKIFIYALNGENISFIDSVAANKNSKYKFSFEHKHTGFYRLFIKQNQHLDFIYDEEKIEIETDAYNILDSLKIVESESNKLYYQFRKLNKEYKTKTELLQLILIRYPKDDDFYQTTKNKLNQIQEEYNQFVNVTSQENQNSFIARYIKSAQLPIINYEIPPEKQLEFLKSHALDYIDFNYAELINSDAFTNKSIEYLTYYRNPQLPKELLEKEFMKAVDSLLNKAKVNQLVYQHVTEYLIDGFKKFGFDKIIGYIIENYVIEDDLCLDEETENSIQKRIDQAKLLAIGTKVPNIILPDKDGKVIDLSIINSDKTLLVFYATWCPHCKELMPKLNTISKENPSLEILAISLDSKKEDWENFVENNCKELTNINDQNGWDGDLASNYYIYATPTMFLLDNDKKIIGKPTTYVELLKLF